MSCGIGGFDSLRQELAAERNGRGRDQSISRRFRVPRDLRPPASELLPSAWTWPANPPFDGAKANLVNDRKGMNLDGTGAFGVRPSIGHPCSRNAPNAPTAAFMKAARLRPRGAVGFGAGTGLTKEVKIA